MARSLLFHRQTGTLDVRVVEELMNSDVFKGQWKQLKGDIKMRWNQLTDDDIETIDGAMEKLEGRLQERYGWEKERVSREIETWGRDRGVVS